MKDVGPLFKTITEQANDPNGRDPFEPLPIPFVHGGSSPEEREKQELETEKLHVAAKLASIRPSFEAIKQLYNSPAFAPYSSNNGGAFTYAQKKNAKPAAGHAIVDGYDFDLAVVSPKTAKWLVKYGPMLNTLSSRIGSIERRIKAIDKEIKAQAVAAKATAQGVTANTSGTSAASQIPVAQIPKKLQTAPNSGLIDNPYFKSGEYAGPPSGYKFSTPMRTIYLSLESTLKRHGLTLGTLYVGRHGGAGGPINFVTATQGNLFVWRKYDAGGGSGQNWVFLNGRKMNTSAFMNMPEAARDAALKINKVI